MQVGKSETESKAFDTYLPVSYDEMKTRGGDVSDAYKKYTEWLKRQPDGILGQRNEQADVLFRRMGITFAVYGEQKGVERLIPFDPIPRIVSHAAWEKLNAGICQRVKALNRFIHDVYTSRDIIRAGLIEEDKVLKNTEYRPEVEGFIPANGVHVHISGIDIVRTGDEDFFVLEDNLRTMSPFRPLTATERMTLDSALAAYRKTDSVPCTVCEYCIPCPVGVEIPKVFAAYNQYKISGDRTALNKTLASLPEDGGPSACISCGACEKKCPQNRFAYAKFIRITAKPERSYSRTIPKSNSTQVLSLYIRKNSLQLKGQYISAARLFLK